MAKLTAQEKILNKCTTGSIQVKETNLNPYREQIIAAMDEYALPYKQLLREVIMRNGMAFPVTEEDELWFNQWPGNAEVVQRVLNFIAKDNLY